jgi:N-acetylneuraminic acid mutarotase
LSQITAGNVWFTMAPMPTARTALAAASVNGKVYAVGGMNATGQTFLNTVEVYDSSTNSWSTAASMPAARSLLAAAAVNGKVYAIGGTNISTGFPLNTVEVYDPNSNSWTTSSPTAGGVPGPVAPMPTPRQGLAAAVVNGKVYAIGGVDSVGNVLNIVEVYDPISNSWNPPGPLGTPTGMPTARVGLAAAVVNGKIYAVGGEDGTFSIIFNTVEVYDPSTNSWSTAGSMPTARLNLAAAAVNGKVYAIAGEHSTSSLISNTVEVYDPGSDSWSTAASRPTASNGLGAAAAGGLIYAIGGFTGASVVSATEQYSPPVTVYTFIKN